MKKKAIFTLLALLSLGACTNPEVNSSSENSLGQSSDTSQSNLDSSMESQSSEASSSVNQNEDPVLKGFLAKIKQDVQFDGTYELEDADYSYVHEIRTVFTTTKYLSREVYYREDLPEVKYQQFNDILSYEDNKVYYITHNLDNTVTKTIATDQNQTPFSWDVFQNPFLNVNEADFAFIDSGKYSLNPEIGLDIGIAITGWNHSACITFEIEILESSVNLEFVLDSLDGEIAYSFVASNFGTATIDTEPFEHTSGHEKLQTALQSIQENYTMQMLDHAFEEGSEDITNTLYKTETHYFDEFNQVGYLKIDDKVKAYELTDEAISKYEDAEEENPFIDHLDLTSFAAEIFEETEANVFILKDRDLAGAVVAAFSNNSDDKLIGQYLAIDAKITLTDEGQLDKFEYYYDAYGLVAKRTITFENIGTTALPTYVLNALEAYDDKKDDSLIPNKYIGIYEGALNDDNQINGLNTLSIEITDTTITINEIVAVIVSYDDYEGFTLTIDGKTYYMCTNSYDEEESVQSMFLASEDYTIYSFSIVRKSNEDEDTSIIPSKFIGKFEGILCDGDNPNAQINGSNDLQVEITSTSITINGLTATIVEYDPYEDFTLTIDGITYYLCSNDNDDPTNELFFADEDYEIYCFSLVRVEE